MYKRQHQLSAASVEEGLGSRESSGEVGSSALGLDALDLRILQLMQSDASRTFGQVSQTIGISQGQCWRRVERLRQAGVIQKTVAKLNRHKMGLHVEVFVQVAVMASDKTTHAVFCDSMRAVPEVVECYATSGEYNLLLRVLVRDLSAYGRLVHDKILSQPGIAKLSATISVSRCKDDALPVIMSRPAAGSSEAAE